MNEEKSPIQIWNFTQEILYQINQLLISGSRATVMAQAGSEKLYGYAGKCYTEAYSFVKPIVEEHYPEIDKQIVETQSQLNKLIVEIMNVYTKKGMPLKARANTASNKGSDILQHTHQLKHLIVSAIHKLGIMFPTPKQKKTNRG